MRLYDLKLIKMHMIMFFLHFFMHTVSPRTYTYYKYTYMYAHAHQRETTETSSDSFLKLGTALKGLNLLPKGANSVL